MTGKRVLVTGASKGIGRAVADRVAASGDLPVGLARTRPDDFPGEFYEVDFADRGPLPKCSTRSSASGTDRRGGQQRRPRTVRPDRLDRPGRSVRHLRHERARRCPGGPGGAARNAGRRMGPDRQRHQLDHARRPERTPYAASKAALEAAPGSGPASSRRPASPSTRWRQGLSKPRCTASAARSDPSARSGCWKAFRCGRVGTPREIAHAICALLDEDAGYITGQIIRADGGGSIAA